MKLLKRTLSLLLVLLLILSVMPTAFAQVLEEKDTYVLERPDNPYFEPTETRPNMQYASLYSADYTYDTKTTYIQPVLYSMYHTTTGVAIPTYCLDINVDAHNGVIYRRMNLEDSSYSSSSAGMIRAIMHKGFYVNGSDYDTDAAHKAAIASKLATLGTAAGVENLTIGEAISATQCALWQVAHGSTLSFSNFVRTYIPKGRSGVRYLDICNEEYFLPPVNGVYNSVTLTKETAALISNRIGAVFDYLLSLEPMAPTSKVVSPASFTKLSAPTFTKNEDGTYNVSITATVDVEMASGDDLTLQASIGEKSATKSLKNGKQSATLSITDIPAANYGQDVTLTISGHQTASGVFLFDADGGREVSQTMVAISHGQMPVYASVVAQEPRVLNFYKTSRNTPSRMPLEGIIFDIYPAATMEEYLEGTVTLPEPEDYPIPALPEFTVITDEEGRASINLTQFGLPDGMYLVVEREHPAIVAPLPPFYVMVPNLTEDGSYDYNVTLSPKNDVKGSISIEKHVISLGNTSASADAYEDHTWIITVSIPEDIGTSKSYVVTDTLDNRLDYAGNMQVRVESANGETVLATLTADTDYTLALTDVDSLEGEHPSDAFTLTLTDGGKQAIAAAVGNKTYADYRLRIYYDAQINANADMGEEIPNQARVKYTNSLNIKYSADSNVPIVATGAANLLKVDAKDHSLVLPGAVFELYRPATAEELKDPNITLVTLTGHDAKFIQVSFFDNAALTGEKVSSITSGEDGKIAIYGLAYGTYYLVETQPPVGYNTMGEAVAVTIDATSHQESKTVVLENRSGAVLPSTGGIGTTVFTASGIQLIAFSILLILSKKRNATH